MSNKKCRCIKFWVGVYSRPP